MVYSRNCKSKSIKELSKTISDGLSDNITIKVVSNLTHSVSNIFVVIKCEKFSEYISDLSIQ
jgi:hypothetical protein